MKLGSLLWLPMMVFAIVSVSATAPACGASPPPPAPTAEQQAKVDTYGDALKACDAKLAVDKAAAIADGGKPDRSELLGSYQACAHAVDVQWGRVDGGGP